MKKNKKIRCKSPVKNAEKGFCGYHMNHEPDFTWEEFQKLSKEPTNSEIINSVNVKVLKELKVEEEKNRKKIKETQKFLDQNKDIVKVSVSDDYEDDSDEAVEEDMVCINESEDFDFGDSV